MPRRPAARAGDLNPKDRFGRIGRLSYEARTWSGFDSCRVQQLLVSLLSEPALHVHFKEIQRHGTSKED
jgi:hypothetical protein